MVVKPRRTAALWWKRRVLLWPPIVGIGDTGKCDFMERVELVGFLLGDKHALKPALGRPQLGLSFVSTFAPWRTRAETDDGSIVLGTRPDNYALPVIKDRAQPGIFCS